MQGADRVVGEGLPDQRIVSDAMRLASLRIDGDDAETDGTEPNLVSPACVIDQTHSSERVSDGRPAAPAAVSRTARATRSCLPITNAPRCAVPIQTAPSVSSMSVVTSVAAVGIAQRHGTERAAFYSRDEAARRSDP